MDGYDSYTMELLVPVYGGSLWTGFKIYPTDAAMTQDDQAYLTDRNGVSFSKHNRTLSDIQDPFITWVRKTPSLESKVVVFYIADASAFTGNFRDLCLGVTYIDSQRKTVTAESRDFSSFGQNQDRDAFDFSQLRVAELRAVLSAAIYEGDVQVSPTLEYSVDTYCNGKTGVPGELCRAMIAYSDSALAFFKK